LRIETLEDRCLLSASGEFYQPPQVHLRDVDGFLSGPSSDEPLQIAIDYARSHAGDLGLSAGDLDHFVVTDQYTSANNGVTHLYLRQTYRGLEVLGADLHANIATDGRVINLAGSFVPGLVDTAKAALAAAEASLARARTNLDYTVIRSPIDGTVIKRNVEAGQTVAASLNTPTLFLIARNLKQMQIEADVDESDIGQIRNGQEVRFTVQSYNDQIFHGTVSQIRLQPRTVSNVVNYTVLVEAENADDLLLPGMTATLDFVVSKIEDALLAPNAALRFQPSGEQAEERTSPAKSSGDAETMGTLYVLKNDGAGLQSIQVAKGETDGISTVVSGSGVSEGLQVINGIKPEVAGKQTNLFSFLRPQRRSSGGRP